MREPVLQLRGGRRTRPDRTAGIEAIGKHPAEEHLAFPILKDGALEGLRLRLDCDHSHARSPIDWSLASGQSGQPPRPRAFGGLAPRLAPRGPAFATRRHTTQHRRASDADFRPRSGGSSPPPRTPEARVGRAFPKARAFSGASWGPDACSRALGPVRWLFVAWYIAVVDKALRFAGSTIGARGIPRQGSHRRR
jgi:hypothetical protein